MSKVIVVGGGPAGMMVRAMIAGQELCALLDEPHLEKNY